MATFSPLTVMPQSAPLMPGRVCADRQVHSRSAPRTRVETDMRSPGLTTLTPRGPNGTRTAKRVGRHEADSSADDLGTLRVRSPDCGPDLELTEEQRQPFFSGTSRFRSRSVQKPG